MIDLSITLLMIFGGFGALAVMALGLHWILDRAVGVMMPGQRPAVPQVSDPALDSKSMLVNEHSRIPP